MTRTGMGTPALLVPHNRERCHHFKGKHTPCFLLSLVRQLEVPGLLREQLEITMSGDSRGAKDHSTLPSSELVCAVLMGDQILHT